MFILANCECVSLKSSCNESQTHVVNDTSEPRAAKIEVVSPFRALKTVLSCGASFVRTVGGTFPMLRLWRARTVVLIVLNRDLTCTEPLFQPEILSAQLAQLV